MGELAITNQQAIEAMQHLTTNGVAGAGTLTPSREQIVRLQEKMVPHQCQQPDPEHFFAPGMYLRTLLVPKSMLLVGKIHKHAHFLMVLKGRAIVVSEFGNEVLESGYIGVSQPGVKRVVRAVEDTLFVTVHVNPSDTHNLETIESEHIEPEILVLSSQQFKESIS